MKVLHIDTSVTAPEMRVAGLITDNGEVYISPLHIDTDLCDPWFTLSGNETEDRKRICDIISRIVLEWMNTTMTIRELNEQVELANCTEDNWTVACEYGLGYQTYIVPKRRQFKFTNRIENGIVIMTAEDNECIYTEESPERYASVDAFVNWFTNSFNLEDFKSLVNKSPNIYSIRKKQ